jgi:hypothetical protein
MTLGVEVRARTARVARGIPVETGTLYAAGPTATGPTDKAVELRSLGDFTANFGVRASGNADLYDYFDTFFSEGGKHAWASSIQGVGTADAALALFDPDLGPGQVALVGQTDQSAAWDSLATHCVASSRVALLDVDVDSDVAAMTTMGASARSLADNDRVALFGPWAEVPPPSGVLGATARQVPASAAAAGLCARVDAQGNPNRAAAGMDFPLQFVTGLVNPVSKTDREALFDVGVNTLSDRYGMLLNYGFDTPRTKDDNDPYVQFSASRTRMYIEAMSRVLGEPFVFRPLDALGHSAQQLKGSLEGMLLGLYQVDGLFGASAREAFSVEVGAAVNTIGTTVKGELHAVCEVRFTKYAQAVIIDLVTVPLTGNVSQ